MKAQKPKNIKNQSSKQQTKALQQYVVQRKKIINKQTEQQVKPIELAQQNPNQLENYKAFFHYLLSSDYNELADLNES